MKLRFGREFLAKFSDTYIRLRKHAGDDPILFWITGVPYEVDDENFELDPLTYDYEFMVRGEIYNEVSHLWDSVNIDISEYIIDLSLPETGYNNNDTGAAMYVGQEPRRQWKRTLSGRILASDNHKGCAVYNNIHIPSVFFPVFPPIKVAIEDVINNINTSVAINRDYAVGIWETNDAVVCLYHHTLPVGIVDKDEKGEYCIKVPKCCDYITEDIEQFIKCEVLAA